MNTLKSLAVTRSFCLILFRYKQLFLSFIVWITLCFASSVMSVAFANNISDATIAQSPIGHNKLYFVDDQDRVMIFHGMIIMQKDYLKNFYFTQFYAPDTANGGTLGESWAKLYADNGFNLARVGISWAGVEPSPGVYDDSYILKIRDMVRMFGKYGVFVVLDFHQDSWSGEIIPFMAPNATFGGSMFPVWAANINLNGIDIQQNNPTGMSGGNPFNNFESPALRTVWDNFWHDRPAFSDDTHTSYDTKGVQSRFIEMYAHVAKFFKEEKNLLYYEDLNEPVPDIQTWQALNQPTFLQMLSNTNPSGPLPPDILIQNPAFFQTLFYDFHERLHDAIRSIDKKHMIGQQITFYELIGRIPVIPKPSDPNVILSRTSYGIGASAQNKTVYGESVDIAKNNQMGFMAIEFGGGNDGATGTAAAIKYFEDNQLSWCYWAFTQGFSVPASVGSSILFDYNKPPVGDNLYQDRLNIITQVYPRVISGTPVFYHYDPITKIFDFEYSTQKANGDGAFHYNSLTEIAVPARVYSNGYSVSVINGEVVSKPNSNVLIIKSGKDKNLNIKVHIEPQP